MEFVIGIILVLTFFGLAYYCVKGHNLMIGFLIISIVWTALSLLGTLVASPTFIAENPILQFGGDSGTTLVSILNKIYQSAPEGWGTTLVNVCWGAWFGRVLMETGIASTLIRKTVELGGDRPIITIVLLNVVDCLHLHRHDGRRPRYRHRRYRPAHPDVPGHPQGNRHVHLHGFGLRWYVPEPRPAVLSAARLHLRF